MSPRLSCKHRPLIKELTIKAPPEVGYLISDSEGKPARYVHLMESFYGLTSAPRGWWLDITQKLSQLGWKPMSTDQCLWCRYSGDGELKGVIGIHVDDFLIGLADGILGEKWMSEIKSLYRWGSWKVSESEFAGIRVRQHRDFSITVDLGATPTDSSLKLPSHVNDQDNDKSL